MPQPLFSDNVLLRLNFSPEHFMSIAHHKPMPGLCILHTFNDFHRLFKGETSGRGIAGAALP